MLLQERKWEEEEAWQWVEIDSRRTIRVGMFVAQVVGKSMEPLIPDGSHCLFASPVTGSRQGRVVLVKLSDDTDPETGERFTIKRYESEKVKAADGAWRHVRVTLKPQNPAFDPIVLTSDDEGLVHVVAEFIEVVG
jgi:SOS-response transcriptional repressor LexA